MRASRELFEGAADVIRERGHTKFTLEGPEGAVCLWGALNVADHGIANWAVDMSPVAESEVNFLLMDVVTAQYPDRELRPCFGFTGVVTSVDFNNHDDTTPEDVIAVLEKAAVRAEETVNV